VVRRLSHLSRIQGMKIRVVVAYPLDRGVKCLRKPLDSGHRTLVLRQRRKSGVHPPQCFQERRKSILIKHQQSPALVGVASHFLTATPYPIAPPSSAIPVVPAASGNLHLDTTSTFRSLPAWPFRPRGDCVSLRQTAPVLLPHFSALAAIPAAPPLSPRLSRALDAFFA